MSIWFDPRDHVLLEMVKELAGRERQPKSLRSLANPYLHPHGIKEMAASRGIRIASAAIALLNSIETGKARERLDALRMLHQEVLHSATSGFRRNTARALLAIMKDLIRSQSDPQKQLQLAHDFHQTASGKLRIVRRMLRRYHLLEMPEEWNQVTFDDHVHDASTKGRKSPTHLVMDAWIKGIRYLTVVYYNYVRKEVAAELLEAAEITGVQVRIGIEIPARFWNKYIGVIWAPRGFLSPHDFLEFLDEPPVHAFLEENRAMSEYKQRYVLRILDAFNTRHSLVLNSELEIELPPVAPSEFLTFVSEGQPSILHLAEFLFAHIRAECEKRHGELLDELESASGDRKEAIRQIIGRMNDLDAGHIWERFLCFDANPDIPNPTIHVDDPDRPSVLRRTVGELIERIHQIPAGYRLTLNVCDLSIEDVLEIIWESKGRITHLEIFNLKDFTHHKDLHYTEIDALRHMLNRGDIIQFKRVLKGCMDRLESSPAPEAGARLERFRALQKDTAALMTYYSGTALSAWIGSDSAGRSRTVHGMGLAILDTLPRRARLEIRSEQNRSREIVPVRASALLRRTFVPRAFTGDPLRRLLHRIGRLPGLRFLSHERRDEWVFDQRQTRIESPGNVATLGGLGDPPRPVFRVDRSTDTGTTRSLSFQYLDTRLRSAFKIGLGLLPAFLTFYLTKDWWVLAYFGAFIWFGITSLRNIIQSVLGGGGIRRSPLVRWNDLISWTRIADSLLFTGFSVPLLDYLVKSLMLDQSLGINAATHPVLLYTAIALANGAYLATHNAARSLPKSAIIGNLFRSVVSIPLALAINDSLSAILPHFGIFDTGVVLQNWAAIISKLASDTVAGFIEGLADRMINMDQRLLDYREKIQQMQTCHRQLELLYPDRDALSMLVEPKELMRDVHQKAAEIERILISNALDLMYFYMYQPRARTALEFIFRSMNHDEKLVFVRAQSILARRREISQIFVDGLVGKYFSKALAFYLERGDDYLKRLARETNGSQ